MAGMNLRQLAIDFARRNCEGCQRRDPVSFPNWSELLDEEAEARRVTEESQATAERAHAARLERRSADRAMLRNSLSPQSAGVLDLVGELDETNSSEVGERLISAARADPGLIEERIQGALVALLEEGGYSRSTAALVSLSIARGVDDFCVNWALRLLARYEAIEEAADVVSRAPFFPNDSTVAEAIPALISLATPEHFPFGNHEKRPVTGPLEHVFALHPQAVRDTIRAQLRSPRVHERRRACDAIELLLDVDSELAIHHARDLVAAALLPADDSSLSDDPSRSVAVTLGHSLAVAPQRTEAALESILGSASESDVALRADCYAQVMRRYPLRESEPDDADRIALRGLLHLVSHETPYQGLRAISDALGSSRDQLASLFAEFATEALGVAAILCESPGSSSSGLSIEPEQLQVLDQLNRRTTISSIRSSLIEKVATAGRAYPELARTPYLDVLNNLSDDGATSFKMSLVYELGTLVSGSTSLAFVLPHLYSAMMSAEPALRASGAAAFGNIAKVSGLDLPPLLVEAFYLALGDPFVAVHRSAVETIHRTHLSTEILSRCHRPLLGLINAYRRDADEHFFLAKLIEVFVDTSRALDQFPEPLSDAIAELLDTLNADEKLMCLRDVGTRLHDTERRFSLCLGSLEHACRQELHREDILRIMRTASPAIWRVFASDVIEVSLACDFRFAATSPDLIEGLCMAGCWQEAHELAKRRLDSIPDTERDRGHRLWQAQFVTAAAIEVAVCESGDPSEAIAKWRTASDEFEDHDDETRRSSPFSDILEKSRVSRDS